MGNHKKSLASRNAGEPINGTSDCELQERLEAAMEEVAEAIAKGQTYDRQSLLEKYADVAVELDECLVSFEFVQTVAPQLATSDGDNSSAGSTPMSSLPHRLDLGDFRIVRELGRGGMGVVYEAEQTSLGRRVALKVLPYAAFLDPVRLQRFKQEAQAAAALRHSNIVHVNCVGIERGVHYYAMDLIDGKSLADVITEIVDAQKNRPVRQSQDTEAIAQLSTLYSSDRKSYCDSIASLGILIADALQYAHDRGIVHRDIKPSNLILDALGNPWITDFGLAQIQDDRGLTITGDILGTLRYMSPEQAEGKKLLDHRTDIYSLGITLYELLTLRQAVDATDRKQLLRQLEEFRPSAPRAIDRQIPKDLETILLKAMSADPANRYDSAKDLSCDLRRYQDDKPILARRVSHFHHAVRWVRRNRVVAGLVAMVSLLIVALAIGGPIYAIRYARLAQTASNALSREVDLRNAQIRFLSQTLLSTNRGLENVPGVDELHEKLLIDTISQYDRLLSNYGENSFVKFEVASGFTELAHIHSHRFLDHKVTLQLFRRAIEIMDDLLQNSEDKLEYRVALAKSLVLAADQTHDPKLAKRALDVTEQLILEEPNERHRYLRAGALMASGWILDLHSLKLPKQTIDKLSERVAI